MTTEPLAAALDALRLIAATLPSRLLTIGQVAAALPGKGGRRTAPSTITRWILSGCPDRSGRRVKLGALRVGSRWLVGVDDLERFFTALAADPPTDPPPKPTRTETARAEAAARASAALARRGA